MPKKKPKPFMIKTLLLMLYELLIPQWFPFACTINFPFIFNFQTETKWTFPFAGLPFSFFRIFLVQSSLNMIFLHQCKRIITFRLLQNLFIFFISIILRLDARTPNNASMVQNVGYSRMSYVMVKDFVRWIDLVKITTHNQTRNVL